MKKQDALDYHSHGRPGKIAVVPTKPLTNQRDLSLAYSPGVAEPCLEIKDDPELAYKYTAQGQSRRRRHQRHRRARPRQHRRRSPASRSWKARRISSSSSPTSTSSTSRSAPRIPDDVIQLLPAARADGRRHQPRGHPRPRLLLHRRDAAEDAEDPRLPRRPARHGDHLRRRAAQRARGASARSIDDDHVVFSGAGAAAIATAEHYVRARREAREHPHVRPRRRDLRGPRRARWTRTRRASPSKTKARTIADALDGADVFVGLSVAGAVTGEMVAQDGDAARSSSRSPIRCRRSCPRKCAPRAPTRSSPPGAATIRTRSTTSSASRSSSAARSTSRATRDQRGDEDGGDARARRCSPRRTCPIASRALYGLHARASSGRST